MKSTKSTFFETVLTRAFKAIEVISNANSPYGKF